MHRYIIRLVVVIAIFSSIYLRDVRNVNSKHSMKLLYKLRGQTFYFVEKCYENRRTASWEFTKREIINETLFCFSILLLQLHSFT